MKKKFIFPRMGVCGVYIYIYIYIYIYTEIHIENVARWGWGAIRDFPKVWGGI